MNRKKIRSFTFHMMLLSFLALSSAAHSRAAGVSLIATPTTQTVTVGQTAVYTIKINRDNYTDKVTLSATALPAGVTASFIPNVTTATSSTLKLQTATTTPIGTFNINVKATANGITIAPIIVKLTTRPLPSISIAVTPSSQFIVAGQATYYDIAITRFNYEGKLTLSALNLPSGVTALFEPESTYGNSSRMYIFSGGLPFWWRDYGMLVKAHNPFDGIDKRMSFQLRVNYGLIWASQFSAPNENVTNPDIATDVAYDSNGNVYLTGYTYNIPTADHNSWVAKFDSAGNRLWLSMITGLIDDKATDVFVDAAENVYVAGSTRSQRSDIFVAKFAANGAQISQNSLFATPNEEGENGMQFGVGAMGNTTLTAVTRVRITNTGAEDFLHNPSTNGAFDITRFTFDANFIRTSTTIVVDGVGEPKDLAVGGDGSIYLLSEDHSQIPGNFVRYDSRVEKFNASNGQSIYRSLPFDPQNGSAVYAYRLKVDATGNVYAIGTTFYRELDHTLNFSSPWLAKLDTSGNPAWITERSTFEARTEITALDIDAGGNIICAGFTWDSLRGTNPNPGGPDDLNARTDAWFAKYSRVTGAEMSLSQFNVNDKDGFTVVKAGASTFLNSTLYFAGYTLNFTHPNQNTHQDAFLLQCSSHDCGYVP